MHRQAADEVLSVEALVEDVVEQQHGLRQVAPQEIVHQSEVVLAVKQVEILGTGVGGKVALGKVDELVEGRQRIAQTSIGLLRDEVKRLWLVGHTLLRRNVGEVADDVARADATEVEDLTARQYGGNDFVLLSGSQDELHIRSRLLERLEESVEGSRRKHVDLVDDVHFVASGLRRDIGLSDEFSNHFHAVVGGSVQFKDVHRRTFVERPAGVALVARLHVASRVLAVYHLGQNAGAGGFAHATRTAEEKRLSQLAVADGVFECRRDVRLPYNAFKGKGTILSC